MTGRLSNPVPPLVLAVVGAAGAAGVVAGFSPKYSIGVAVGLVFLVVTVNSVAAGVSMMAVLAIVDGEGQLGVAKLAGGVLAASWVAVLLVRRPARGTFASNNRGLAYALVVLFGWAVLSLTWAESTSETISNLARYLPNMLLIPIVFDAVQTRRHMVWLLAAIAGASAIAAAIGIASPPADPSVADASRAGGTFGDANEFASALVAGLPLLLVFALRPQARIQVKFLTLAAAAMSVGAVFLTLSRGGLVALGAALAASVVFAGRWRAKMIVFATGTLAAAAAYFMLFASLPAREHVLNVGGGTGRLDLWTIGERMVQAHPFRGVGVGNFQVSSVHYLLRPGLIQRSDFIVSQPKVAHNTYLQFAAELGIPAAALFVAIIVFCLVCAARAASRFARQDEIGMELLARGALVSMIGYLAAILFLSEITSKLLWLLLGLGPVLLAVARDRPPGQPAGAISGGALPATRGGGALAVAGSAGRGPAAGRR